MKGREPKFPLHYLRIYREVVRKSLGHFGVDEALARFGFRNTSS